MENEIEKQWDDYCYHRAIFNIIDDFTIKLQSIRISLTWSGWLEVGGDKNEVNEMVLDSIKRELNYYSEEDSEEYKNFDDYLIFPYELTRRGLLPNWCYILNFDGSHKHKDEITFFVKGETVIYFANDLHESIYSIAQKIVGQIEWKIQSKPYEVDPWEI